MATSNKSTAMDKSAMIKTAVSKEILPPTTKLVRTSTIKKISTNANETGKQSVIVKRTISKTKSPDESGSLKIKSENVKSSKIVTTKLTPKLKVLKEVADSTTATKKISNISSPLKSTSQSSKKPSDGLVSPGKNLKSSQLTTSAKHIEIKRNSVSDLKTKLVSTVSKPSANLKASSSTVVKLKTKSISAISKTNIVSRPTTSPEKAVSTLNKEINSVSKNSLVTKSTKLTTNVKHDSNKLLTKSTSLVKKSEMKLKSTTVLDKNTLKTSKISTKNINLKTNTSTIVKSIKTSSANKIKIDVKSEVEIRDADSTTNNLINANDLKNNCSNTSANDQKNKSETSNVDEVRAYELAEQILLEVMKGEKHDENTPNNSLTLKTIDASETKTLTKSVAEETENIIENQVTNECENVFDVNQTSLNEKNIETIKFDDNSNDFIETTITKHENEIEFEKNVSHSLDEVVENLVNPEIIFEDDQQLVHDAENIDPEINEKFKYTNDEVENFSQNTNDVSEETSKFNYYFGETVQIGQIDNADLNELGESVEDKNSNIVTTSNEIKEKINIFQSECVEEKIEQYEEVIENEKSDERNLTNENETVENVTGICEELIDNNVLIIQRTISENTVEELTNTDSNYNVKIVNNEYECGNLEDIEDNVVNASNEIDIKENYFCDNDNNVDINEIVESFNDQYSNDDFVIVNSEESAECVTLENSPNEFPILTSSCDTENVQDDVSIASSENLSYAEIVKQSGQSNIDNSSENFEEQLSLSEDNIISTSYEDENGCMEANEKQIQNKTSLIIDVDGYKEISLNDEEIEDIRIYDNSVECQEIIESENTENSNVDHSVHLEAINDRTLTESEVIEKSTQPQQKQEMKFVEEHYAEVEYETYRENINSEIAAYNINPNLTFENNVPNKTADPHYFDEDGFKLMRKRRNKKQNKKYKKSHRPFGSEPENLQEQPNEIYENFIGNMSSKRRNSKRRNSVRKYSKDDSNVYMHHVWKSYYPEN
ncbi:hypothetical protein PGB90_005702 [Kerria lacca]